MPKSSRRPSRCKRCVDRPLLSQCLHSKAGREYLAQRQSQDAQLPEVSDRNLNHVDTATATSDKSRHSSTNPQPSNHSVASMPTQDLTGHDSELVTPRGLADNIDDEVSNEIGLTSTTVKRRVYATSRNPIHGHVEGTKRGNETYSIVRTKPMPKPLIESSLATERFRREMQCLVARCERLAAETGCWLYISGQHSTASRGFISYASPRLRRDGKQKLTELQNSFNALYSSLLDSRRQDALQLSLEVKKSQNQLKSVEAELETQTMLMAEKDAFIAHLQNQLQAQGMTNSETL